MWWRSRVTVPSGRSSPAYRNASAIIITKAWLLASLVPPVVSADVGEPPAIWRPHPVPAAVIGGVDKGSAKEREAVKAMMEEAAMEAVPEREVGARRERCMGRECGMRGKWPACKTGASEMR